MKIRIILLFTLLNMVYGCTANNVLTKEEMIVQGKSDSVVSSVLFENDLSENTSYNIHKNGAVVIKFDESVSIKNYTKVVKLLRSNADVGEVYAEQSGNEVCGLR